jgi:hypothetical protein
MSSEQPGSSDGGRLGCTRERTPSPIRDHTPSEPVEAPTAVPSRAGSCQPASQDDSRPVIVPYADGYVF